MIMCESVLLMLCMCLKLYFQALSHICIIIEETKLCFGCSLSGITLVKFNNTVKISFLSTHNHTIFDFRWPPLPWLRECCGGQWEKREVVVKLRPDIWERVIGYRDNHHATQAKPEALSYGPLSQEDLGVRNIEDDPLCSWGTVGYCWPWTVVMWELEGCCGYRERVGRGKGCLSAGLQLFPPLSSPAGNTSATEPLQAAKLSHSLHPCQQLRKFAVFDDMNKQLTPLSNRKNWRMWPQSRVQKTKKEKVVSEVWISRVLLVKYQTFKHMPGCLTSAIVMVVNLAKISDTNQAWV